MPHNFLITLGYTFVIVISELIAFYLIQKNVDEQEGIINYRMFLSIFLLGVVVTFSFRKILMTGTNVPLANLYWIIFSQLGTIFMSYLFFNITIKLIDWIAIIFFFIYFIVAFLLSNND